MEKKYTLVVFTEDKVGLLNRITIVFTRRHINIDSLTTSESEIHGIFRYTIVAKATPEMMKKVVDQIEKLTEVLRAFYYEAQDVVTQELALYKISTANITPMESLIRESSVRILDIEKEFIIIEKTGSRQEVLTLFEQLKPYGILQFACSGQVAVTKPMKELETYLKELNQAVEASNKIRSWKLKN
ncbi:MAG: acetolactate synthase small subunit [Bacteroidales bacterium]|jgi:acetolactate synthase-1/3 small subunit|nr:acetolactate synthase small subunit [Bacteroidales bacterium]MBR6277732.1 acetolactate synthase small subunit [Bacteroidales bacterium]